MRTPTATRILLILAGALFVFAIAPALAQRAVADDGSDLAAHILSRLRPPTHQAAAPAADDPWPAEYVVKMEDLTEKPDDVMMQVGEHLRCGPLHRPFHTPPPTHRRRDHSVPYLAVWLLCLSLTMRPMAVTAAIALRQSV